jgi:hypothetical protein
LSVGVVQHNTTVDPQNFTGFRKLPAADGAQFMIVPGIATMRGGLPRREADYVDFSPTIVIKPQTPAEGSRFIVGMGSDAEDSRHERILSEQRATGRELQAKKP